MLTTLRTLANTPLRLPAPNARCLVMAGLCAWAGAFAHWCRFSGRAALPLLPTLLLAALVLVALAEGTGSLRHGSARRRRDASWALLAAGSAAIPSLTLGVEFFAHAFVSAHPGGPLFVAVFTGIGTLAVARTGWRAARVGDWPALGGAAALLFLSGNLFWLVLRAATAVTPAAP